MTLSTCTVAGEITPCAKPPPSDLVIHRWLRSRVAADGKCLVVQSATTEDILKDECCNNKHRDSVGKGIILSLDILCKRDWLPNESHPPTTASCHHPITTLPFYLDNGTIWYGTRMPDKSHETRRFSSCTSMYVNSILCVPSLGVPVCNKISQWRHSSYVAFHSIGTPRSLER